MSEQGVQARLREIREWLDIPVGTWLDRSEAQFLLDFLDKQTRQLTEAQVEIMGLRAERDAALGNRDGLKQCADEHYAAYQEAEARAARLLEAYEDQQQRAVDAGERAEAAESALAALREQVEAWVTWCRESEPAINRCIQISTIHGVPYTGKPWPLEQSEAILRATHAGPASGEEGTT